MDMDDIKENFGITAVGIGFVLGGIIIAPFYVIYLIGKGIYYYLPSNIRKRKMEAQEKRDKEEKERQQDAEIEELEKRMGLSTENKFRLFYDRHYYKNPEARSREEYLEDLREKVTEHYASPDIIVAVEHYDPGYYESLYQEKEAFRIDESWNNKILFTSDPLPFAKYHAHKKGILGSGRKKVEGSTSAYENCYVVLLIHKDYYRILADALIRHKETVDSKRVGSFSLNNSASAYFDYFRAYMKHFAFHPSQMTEPFNSYFRLLYTLTECGNYDNYFIVQVPGEFQFSEVEAGTDERLNKFIADFKRKYKKQ